MRICEANFTLQKEEMESELNKSMTRRERVLEAICHHETDIVPYQIDLTSAAGPTHAIPGDTPPENIVALVETCWEQCF